MSALVRGRDVAAHLSRVLGATPEEGKDRRRVVAGLHQQGRVVDGATVDARRRAGLEPTDAERQRAQSFGQAVRRRITCAPAGILLETDVDSAAEKRADGQHDRRRMNSSPTAVTTPATRPSSIAGPRLPAERAQVRLVLDDRADRPAVQRRSACARVARTAGPLLAFKRAELDTGAIGRRAPSPRPAHRSP